MARLEPNPDSLLPSRGFVILGTLHRLALREGSREPLRGTAHHDQAPAGPTVFREAIDMAAALRTTAEVRADIARKLHEVGRMTVVDPDYAAVHGELDELCEELAMLERMP